MKKRQDIPDVPVVWRHPAPDETPGALWGDIVDPIPTQEQIRLQGLRSWFVCSVCKESKATPKGSGSGTYCGGTGYGCDHVTHAPVCYRCCAEREKQSMRDTGRACLYLCRSHDASILRTDARALYASDWTVADWPGELSIPVRSIKRGAHNWRNVQRFDAWFIWEGYVWHGVCLGDTQIIRCKRTRTEWRKRSDGQGYTTNTPRKSRARKAPAAQ